MNKRTDCKRTAFALLILVLLLGSILTGCHTDSVVGAMHDIDTPSLDSTPTLILSSSTPKPIATSTPSPEETPSSEITDITGEMTVHFIDVGQGDSTFIELPTGQTMLIDAGEEGSKVEEYIAKLGYTSIDYLVGTHPHSDHIGGMADIIEKFDIGTIFMPRITHNTQTFEHLLDTITAKELKVNATSAGTVIMDATEGLSIDVLSPSPDQQEYDDLNDYSIVLKISYGGKSFLFMGDASASVETDLGKIDADVLKAGHHGSSTSSSQQFVKQVAPEHVVISCGKDNEYGHPHSEVVDLLVNVLGTNVYATSLNGTIIATTDGGTITFSSAPNSLADLTLSGDNTVNNDAQTKSDIETQESKASIESDSVTEKAEPTTTPESKENDSAGYGSYVGSTKSDKYHETGCRHAKKIKSSNEIWFDSADDARSQGYVPCKVCKP